MKRPLAVLALCALTGAADPSAAPAAQAGSAAVLGEVFDSTAAGPLEGARVVLWGTRHQARTDAEGRFRIEGVPPGDYSAVFFHPRLTELGVAAGNRPLTVATADVEISLGVPSPFTLATAACAGRGGVAVAGVVTDGASGLPLADAPVTFRWAGEDGSPARRSVRTDPGGWYSACGLPPRTWVAVDASFLDRSAARVEISGIAGSAIHLGLPLATLEPSELVATVREAGTGAPVADAEVVVGLPGEGRRAFTDDDGRVVFDDVPPGHYTLRVEHLAHLSRTARVDVASDARVTVAVDVASEPIELAPLEVEVEGVEEAEVRMGGLHITAEEIEAVRARSRDVGDLLRNQRLPGVVVKRGSGGNVCIEFLVGQSRMFRRTCEPMMVMLDGVRVGDARSIFSMPASVIERMQLFRPVEAGIFGLGAGSGVLMITTKAHD